ncbi:MAG: 30S ribosomal protein S20 [Bacilli bacterium]
MPNIKGAIKHVNVSFKKNNANNLYKAPMRTAIKKVEKAITLKDKEKANEALTLAIIAIDKATNKGIIKDNTNARYKSRLTKKVNAL